MASPSCTFISGIPNPPTTSPSCAVPIGGSNSTILDACCMGETNPLSTYGTSGADADCYQYCTTDDSMSVQDCLGRNLGQSDKDGPAFQCFNVVAKATSEYSGAGRSEVGWVMRLVVGLVVTGTVVGVV